MKFDAIIFDLDGVLCTTDHLHYLGWKKLADREGIYFDEIINQRLRGVSRMESLSIILERAEKAYTEEQMMEMAAYKNDQYRLLLDTLNPEDLSHEVKDTLQVLRSMGLKLAVGSSSKNTRLILEKLGLGNFFDAIADGNDITNSKPDPEVFLLAAERIGLTPEKCLVVEDAEAGILAACRGGFRSAGIGPASADPNATYSLTAFANLTALVSC